MKRIALVLALAASLSAAQTPTTPTTPPAKPATSTTKPAVTAKSSTAAKPAGTGTATHTAVAGAIKLPPGIPVYHKLLKTAFALKYQDIEIGTGPVAEPLKLYKVKYTGWLAADGKKFDSSEDHPGKEPIQFPQGRGRVIPGWDQAFEGMKIGGKRRLFIPYQFAYGAMGRPPVIPAKSDLIFDIELVDVTEMPPPGAPGAGRPMPPRPGAAPGAPGAVPPAGTAPKPASPGTPPAGTTPAPPTATPPATQPPATTPQATPPPASTPNPPPADKPANPAQPPQ